MFVREHLLVGSMLVLATGYVIVQPLQLPRAAVAISQEKRLRLLDCIGQASFDPMTRSTEFVTAASIEAAAAAETLQEDCGREHSQ